MLLAAVGCSGDDTNGDSPALSSLGPPTVAVVAGDLINPIGLAETPDGRLLVAEEGTGERDSSAGLSVIAQDGAVARIVSGLPSGRDSGDLSGAPLVGVSPDGATVYVAHFGSGALLTLPIAAAEADPKTIEALGPEDLGRTMTPLNEVTLINPFDITFDTDANPVVSDASGNGVATVDPGGFTVFTHRFGQLRDPAQESLQIDPVPTGISRLGDEYLVTLTGGCPYPRNSGRLVAIGEARAERIVVDGLNMPIDVEVGPDGTVWLLEFATFDPEASCFTGSGYEPATGRLSRVLPDGELDPILTGLDYPGAVLAAEDGTLYVSEVFAGRVLRLTWS